MTDVQTDVTYLRSCIPGTTRQANLPHHFVVGDVVAHIEHLFGQEIVLVEQLLEFFCFDSTCQKDIMNVKSLIAETDGFIVRSCDNGDMKPFCNGKSQGIAILCVHGTHQYAFIIRLDCFRTKDTIDIKSECLYLL